jgi:hypothetical protein
LCVAVSSCAWAARMALPIQSIPSMPPSVTRPGFRDMMKELPRGLGLLVGHAEDG